MMLVVSDQDTDQLRQEWKERQGRLTRPWYELTGDRPEAMEEVAMTRPVGGDGMSYDRADANAKTIEQWRLENPDAADRPPSWWMEPHRKPAPEGSASTRHLKRSWECED
jgi:hypothetical protein